MEFRQALRDIVVNKNMNLTNDESDKAVLVAFGAYCSNNSEMLQLQELKNILSTGTSLGYALLQAYLESKRAGDTSYKALADKIEEIADELEQNNISCFSYAYFISCYLDLFKELFKDDDFVKLDIDSIAWIDPEKYDYGYQSMPTAEKTFGFGRYRASIKEFKIENGMLKKYTGHDPYVVIPYFIKSIGKGAFAGNKKIKSVYIPRSVSKIGAEAFSGCEKLETVVLSEKITQLYSATFEECKILKRINLGNITSVGNRCFKGCIKLESIDMPALTKVGDEAFSYCIALKNIGFVSHLNQIGSKAFERCSMNYVSLESCNKLGSQAFLNCTSLTRIALNSNIESIGVAPFMGCVAVSLLNIEGDSYNGYIHDLFSDNFDDFNQQITELRCIKKDFIKNSEFSGYQCIKEVEIRKSDVIPDQAFTNCTNLTAVKFGQPIIAIGQSAFASCVALVDIDMNFLGEEIATKAFYKCEHLKVKSLLNNVTDIGDFALAYTDLSAFVFSRSFKKIGAFALANAKFPARLSLDLSGCEILPGAFHGVNEISMLRLETPDALYKGQLHLLFDSNVPDFVSKRKINYLFVNGSISAQAFKDYSNIRYIEFVATEGKIPSEAFAGCTALESVKVNGEVSLVEPYAFSGCTVLSMLDMQYASLVVGRNAFNGCQHASAIVDLQKITRFGEYSFANCDITDLSLGENVQYIGAAAFSMCSNIENVVVPFVGCMPDCTQKEKGYFGAIFGTDEYENCNIQRIANDETEIRYAIPSNIRSITVLAKSLNEDCFCGCGFLAEIYLPNIVDFNVSCFKDCASLRFVYLGENLDNFSAKSIAGCERTVRFDISTECEKYAAVNGTVLSKNRDKLYFLDFADKLSAYLTELRVVASYAVSHNPAVISLPTTLETVESYAFNCNNVKSISVDSIDNIMPSAFYNCDVLEDIAITNSTVKGIFEFINSQPTVNRISLSNVVISGVSELLSNAEDVVIDTLSLDGVSIDGAEFFDKVSSVRAIDIKSKIAIVPECMLGANISSLTMCGQSWLVSELLGEESNILSLNIHDAEIHSEEFKGVNVDRLTLENITIIHTSAFLGASVRKLTIKNVANIESGAFVGSQINEISIDDVRYNIVDGILYCEDELVYCFDKKLQKLLVPSFVKRVSAGAIDSLTELRQLSVLHSDISFERRAVVNCDKLNTVELTQISNRVLRELFDSVQSISFVKYTGKTIKRKFFSHMDNLCEVHLTGVSEIGDLAFSGCTEIETITGLNNVTYVGDMAFADCASLKSIVLPASCSRIGVGAFEGCPSLTRITYPIDAHQVEFDISAEDLFGEEVSSSLTVEILGGDIPEGYFESFSANIVVTSSPKCVGNRAFKDSGLTQITLADTLTIGSEAFSGSKIQSVAMPCATHIESLAFSNCLMLKSVVINNSVEQLADNWLLGTSISKLSGAEFGEHYRTASNYLVDQRSSTLIYSAPDNIIRELVIDEGVKRIAASAFNGSNVLYIDASAVDDIEEASFEDCRQLERLVLEELSNGEDNVSLSFYLKNNRTIKSVSVRNGLLVEACFASFDKLESVVLPQNIKSIPPKCFAGCGRLKNVQNLSNIENFGEKAFEGCASLVKLELPFLGADIDHPSTLAYLFGRVEALQLREVSVAAGAIIAKAFANCSHLVLVSLPHGIDIIPEQCFNGCAKLEKVLNLDSVKQIGRAAFMNCSSIEHVTLAKAEVIEDAAFVSCISLIEFVLSGSIKQIGKDILGGCNMLSKLALAFTQNVDSVALLGRGISSSLTDVHVIGNILGKHAFAGCDRLEKVTLSDPIKKITDSAFAGCVKLQSVACGSGVTEIGESAFLNCHELAEIELAPSIATIGKDAFAQSGLAIELNLPNVKEIGARAFSGTNIRSATFGDKLKSIKDATFANCMVLETVVLTASTKVISKEAFSGCKALSDIVLDYVTSIGEKAFFECDSITKLSLLSIDSLGTSAFEECKSLVSVSFNESLQIIPERAFAGCKSLSQINIPGQLTEIGNRAFAATAMKKLELRMPYSLVTVGEYVFEQAYSPVIYVTPNQASKWDSNWGSNCKGHGLFNLSKKVITKKL